MKTITEMLADVEKLNKPRRPMVPVLLAALLVLIVLGVWHG